MTAPGVLTVRGDRIGVPPPGARGGRPGAAGAYRITRADGSEEELNAKQQNVAVDAGDIFTLRTSGGGGLGPPDQRDRAAVAEDLREGRITEAGAAAELVAAEAVAVDPERSQR
jgi:N-methylhydantoinase B